MPVVVGESEGIPASNIVAGLDYARLNGAKITSNSYGGSEYSRAVEDAFKRCQDAGMLSVAAAGNSEKVAHYIHEYPAALRHTGIISVGAMNREGSAASLLIRVYTTWM
jgi:thermitase